MVMDDHGCGVMGLIGHQKLTFKRGESYYFPGAEMRENKKPLRCLFSGEGIIRTVIRTVFEARAHDTEDAVAGGICTLVTYWMERYFG